MNINEVKEVDVLWLVLQDKVRSKDIHMCVCLMEQITKLEAQKTREIYEPKS